MNKLSQNRSRLFTIAGAAAILASVPLGAGAEAAAQAPKADAAIAQMLSAKAVPGSCAVIARLDGDLTPARQARLAALGADVTRHLGFIHSAALTLPRRSLAKLAALPFVTHLSYDGEVKKSDAFTDASSGAAYVRQQYGLTGQGVGVAVIDSGSRIVMDLMNPKTGSSRISAQKNFVPGTVDYTDWCGHGTHVSGIIAGNGAASTGRLFTSTFNGIAPQASLINARVLDAYGAGTVSSVLAGIQWVVANKNIYNIRVMNLSLGHAVSESYTTDPLCQAVEAAWKAGIVVVCAAGNNGRAAAYSAAGAANEGWGTAYGSIQSPGNDPYVITVGATKSMDGVRGDDRIATYSSRGPSAIDFVMKPDIIAPGNHVVSLYAFNTALYAWNSATGNGLPVNTYENTAMTSASNDYFVLSGTSMASPVVAGAAALMLQAQPGLTPDTVKARLMVSADKWLDAGTNPDPYTYGAGYLDIPAALASTVTPTQSALSPTLTLTGSTVTIKPGPLSGTSLWGSKAISGVSAVYGSRAISGVSTVYGSKTISGVNTIFSSASVAASKSLCGSSFNAGVDLSSVALNGE